MQRKLSAIVLLFLISVGLNAQNTHFPGYDPSFKYSALADTDSSEKLSLQWNTTLNDLKQEANASDKDFATFLNYYQPVIDSARLALYNATQAGTNLSGVNAYMKSEQQ